MYPSLIRGKRKRKFPRFEDIPISNPPTELVPDILDHSELFDSVERGLTVLPFFLHNQYTAWRKAKYSRMPKRTMYPTGVRKRRQVTYAGSARNPIVIPTSTRWSARARANLRTGGFLGIENKFYDTKVSGDAIVTTTASAEVDPPADDHCLNAIAQGDGESNRDGRQCRLTSVQLKGLLTIDVLSDQADIPQGNILRVIIYHDKQTNGAQAQSEQVLLDTAGVDLCSLRNPQYNQRFTVWMDRIFDMSPTTAGTDGANTNSIGQPSKYFEFYKKLDLPVNFTSTTSNIANITDNSIHVIAIAQAAGAKISYQARVKFIG